MKNTEKMLREIKVASEAIESFLEIEAVKPSMNDTLYQVGYKNTLLSFKKEYYTTKEENNQRQFKRNLENTLSYYRKFLEVQKPSERIKGKFDASHDLIEIIKKENEVLQNENN